jgi:hypothetical protein
VNKIEFDWSHSWHTNFNFFANVRWAKDSVIVEGKKRGTFDAPRPNATLLVSGKNP